MQVGREREREKFSTSKFYTIQVQSTDETVKSTFYRDGRFYLALDNPLTTDNYTCSLDPVSPASHCVRPDSSIITGLHIRKQVHTNTRARRQVLTKTHKRARASATHAHARTHSDKHTQICSHTHPRIAQTKQIC